MVSDAARAIVNSIKKAFPDCQYLMCWFYLKMNVRKHKNLIPAVKYRRILNGINALYNCDSKTAYNLLLKLT
jgi:hypothetical protein